MPKPQDTLQTALVILAEAGAVLDLHKPADAKRVADAFAAAQALERIQRAMRRRAEHACNFPMTEAETAAADAADEKAAKRAADIVKPYRLALNFGGDPRGSQVRILTPKSGRANTWGGAADGWAV